MKKDKFKIERKRVEEIEVNLTGMLYRCKLMLGFLIQENINEEYYQSLCIIYRETIAKVFLMLGSIQKLKGESIIITKEILDYFDYFSNILKTVEEVFSNSGKYSLTVH